MKKKKRQFLYICFVKDLKYLFAYTVPLATLISFNSFGIGTYTAVFYAFVVLPVLDVVLGKSSNNLTESKEEKKLNKIFDWMLYINLPIVYILMLYGFNKVSSIDYTITEKIGLYLSGGILLATNGINVAHELCHRENITKSLSEKLCFLPCLYMHFYIEHNFGHHVSIMELLKMEQQAKYKQSVYSFWITSVSKQYVDAWKMQLKLLKGRKNHFFSIKKRYALVPHYSTSLFINGVVFIFY